MLLAGVVRDRRERRTEEPPAASHRADEAPRSAACSRYGIRLGEVVERLVMLLWHPDVSPEPISPEHIRGRSQVHLALKQHHNKLPRASGAVTRKFAGHDVGADRGFGKLGKLANRLPGKLAPPVVAVSRSLAVRPAPRFA
jgi:hypothetical protein